MSREPAPWRWVYLVVPGLMLLSTLILAALILMQCTSVHAH